VKEVEAEVLQRCTCGRVVREKVTREREGNYDSGAAVIFRVRDRDSGKEEGFLRCPGCRDVVSNVCPNHRPFPQEFVARVEIHLPGDEGGYAGSITETAVFAGDASLAAIWQWWQDTQGGSNEVMRGDLRITVAERQKGE